MEIGEIFVRLGEEAFRQMEHEALCRYVAQPDLIISPGGGAVMQYGEPCGHAGALLCDQSFGAAADYSGARQSGAYGASGAGTASAGAK